MKPNTVFVLGAYDPEMRAIRYMLGKAGYRTAVANRFGKRCVGGNAYNADSLSKAINPNAALVWVECRSPSFTPGRDVIVDHHNKGDPGYAAQPGEYWEGSSIGQIAELIGVKRGKYAELAAASDHCLSAAMRGECKGACPSEVMEWRINVRASMMEIEPRRLRRRIDMACERLNSLPVLDFGGEKILDGSFDSTPELRDAAAIAGKPIITTRQDLLGRVKIGLYGARCDVVSEWLATIGNSDIADSSYGNPNREYAGVVLNEDASQKLLRNRYPHRARPPEMQ